MADKVALIDLDGTIADYDKSIRRHMKKLRGPKEPAYQDRFSNGGEEPGYIEARRTLIQRQPGFWRKLEPIAEGFQVLGELAAASFSLHVLTKGPRSSPNAWTEKVEWVERHLGWRTPVTISSDKSLVYGRILVDDFPDYFRPWLQVRPRGLVVCVAQPWNADYAVGGAKEHPNVLRYEGNKDRVELRRRLKLAFERNGVKAG